MTGRVFTKLLFSFMLLLSLGTAFLDVSVRRIVEHSLSAVTVREDQGRAARMAAQIASAPADAVSLVAQAQARAARASVRVVDRGGAVVAEASGLGQLRRLRTTSTDRGVGSADLFSVSAPAGAYRVEYRFSLARLHATMRLLRRDLLIASLLSLALATLLAAYMASRVARRMARIVRFANRIAAGELSARVEEGRLDEVSDVAHALDATAVRLEESFRALDGSRRELAVLLDSMQEAVLGISAQSQVTWSNARMQALSPAALREGRALVECIRDPDVLATVNEALETRTLARGRATTFVAGRAFAVSAAPMPGGGAVVVLHDVTEVERAERTRRDFVANVSHELRTPLTSITGYVETVLDGELSGDARDFLEIVLRNARRMNRLTADLLALATVEAGDYRIDPRPVPASALIEDAVDGLAGMASDAGIRLEMSEAPETPVMADADALNQVFGNLIENAMKYGSSGGRVRLGACAAGETVEFSVRDEGPGIASEHLTRIFERFYRVDKARSLETGGTGLGLAIVKHIVLAHGGTIRAESELGAGAAFLFTLPTAAAVAPEAEEVGPELKVSADR